MHCLRPRVGRAGKDTPASLPTGLVFLMTPTPQQQLAALLFSAPHLPGLDTIPLLLAWVWVCVLGGEFAQTSDFSG